MIEIPTYLILYERSQLNISRCLFHRRAKTFSKVFNRRLHIVCSKSQNVSMHLSLRMNSVLKASKPFIYIHNPKLMGFAGKGLSRIFNPDKRTHVRQSHRFYSSTCTLEFSVRNYSKKTETSIILNQLSFVIKWKEKTIRHVDAQCMWMLNWYPAIFGINRLLYMYL